MASGCLNSFLLTAHCHMQLLEFYDLRNKAKWAFVGYEAVFIAVFFVFAWLALTFIRHQKR